jgi:hypothetical protein
LQVLSFFNFIKKYNKPKILVIEYPPSAGYTFFENTTAITYYSKHSPTTHYNDVYDKLCNTDFLKNEAAIYRNMLQVLCKQCDIKLVEVSFNKDDAYVSNDIIIVDQDIINNEEINLRFGRDVFKFNSGDRAFSVELPYGNATSTLRWNRIIKENLFANVSFIYNDYNFQLKFSQQYLLYLNLKLL